ncbi:hypothetical protein [Streptomyces javensis]|uniref:Uncharacterized protein n=1 Tax=Streptomyces javensis TaxID=114698 RepID=A0ABS0R5P3_9ACTN|nr:hypothetical protein [Streptomyces javensis]MBI0312702.1 hypothetical protein [Streptomyces javensis]
MPRRKPTTRTDHQAAAEGLREIPGLALTVAVCPAPYTAATLAWDIRHGRYAYTPAGAYSAYTELAEDGTAVVARYVGETAAVEPELETA